jgi:hypothetical protein
VRPKAAGNIEKPGLIDKKSRLSGSGWAKKLNHSRFTRDFYSKKLGFCLPGLIENSEDLQAIKSSIA